MPEAKKQRAVVIGKEVYEDGGNDAMDNMFYSIEFRIKGEIDKDASQYRSWWNNISNEWKY
ncbi:MAG: hypothetical protein ACRD93_08855 [Nitrososphaeraceae archaeon]|jgi:hypothetical protein